MQFKFLEFDFWPIQYNKQDRKPNIGKRNRNNKLGEKIIICPIQKFDEPRKGWKYLYQSIIDFQNQLSSNKINLHFIFIGNLEKSHIESFKNFRVSYEYYNYLK